MGRTQPNFWRLIFTRSNRCESVFRGLYVAFVNLSTSKRVMWTNLAFRPAMTYFLISLCPVVGSEIDAQTS